MDIVILKLAESVGLFLRQHREKRGAKQKDIADAASISVSMLSQIERGITSPSIETLGQLCGALDISVSEVFAAIEEKSDVTISHRRDRLIIKENGVVFEEVEHYVTPKISRTFYRLSLDPSSDVTIAATHRIGEEIQMGFVLSGSATLTVDGDEYDIGTGDVVSFKAKHEHKISNKSRASFTLPKKFVVLWMATPPRRDRMVFTRRSESLI